MPYSSNSAPSQHQPVFDMEFLTCVNDDSLGPFVLGCRDDFDFTLKFEKIFLSALPAVIFTVVSVPRFLFLAGRPAIVKGSIFKYIKLAAQATYGALQLILLILSTRVTGLANIFAVSSALSLIASLCMCALTPLEHSRSPRPSILLNGFLSLTLLFDIVQSRSLWLSAKNYDGVTFSRLFTAAAVLKAALIGLESFHLDRWLRWDRKEHSPEETSGLYGLGAFTWLNSLFMMGYNSLMGVADLFPLDPALSAAVHQERLSRRLQNANSRGKANGLAIIIVKTLSVPFFLPVGPRVALMGFSLCQPFLVESILDNLQQPKPEANTGKGLICATALIYFGISASQGIYWYFQERAMYMVRCCLASAVYKKTTQSTLSAVSDSAVLTLMSADIEKIRVSFLQIHEFWANTIQVILASWLLQRQLGAAFAAPIAVVILCIGASSYIVRAAGPRQRIWMEKLQKRVGLTARVVGDIKNLKISGLASPVEDAVQELRLDELYYGTRFRMIEILAATVAFCPLLLGPVFTFAVTSSTLDIKAIYTSISYLLLLANPLVNLFHSLPGIPGGLACFRRIQVFLEKDQRNDFREGGVEPIFEKPMIETSGNTQLAFKITNGNFGWVEGKYCLKDLSVIIPSSKLTIVVGPIGSGKSTFCKVLLGETPISRGKVVMGPNSRKIGFCDQTPFLSNTSIRQNIVGFSPFDEKRYREVIRASMLVKDLLLFPQSDHTKIGSNGITLSGGQKQRVSIARALYLESDLLIFDDILSGLDADTEEQIFSRVFGPSGILRQRHATGILCTHSLRHLPSANHIIALGADGSLIEEGSYKKLIANKKYVYTLRVPTSDGVISESTATHAGPEDAMLPAAYSQTAEQGVVNDLSDQARRTGDSGVYRHYFRSISNFWIFAFVFSAALTGFFYNFPTVWLRYWAEDMSSEHPTRSNSFYIGMYAFFQSMALASLSIEITIGLRVFIQASGAALHKDALSAVIRAPLSYFTTTDSGMITTLFSQDLNLIDGELPMALFNVTLDIFLALGMASLITSSAPWVAIGYPFLGVALFCIQMIYLRTSRQLRLLDLEAKAPMYTHFLDTSNGLATFRALGWADEAVALCNRLIDTSQRPAYLLAMIQRWLTLVLSIVVALMAIVVVTLATQLQSDSGFTGAGLIALMSFGDELASIVRTYATLETSIGAVSRLKSFSENTKSEHLPGEDDVPPESWPERGIIEVKGVSASYGEASSTSRSTGSLAILDLNLTIEAGEKVAICGRSGSGKSSTMLLLLRLLDPLPSCSANMTIDGLPLHTMNRDILRQRLIAVPQEAVFLPDGTSWKANLDPFHIASDADCQSVLETVDLWALATKRGGLAASIAGDTLSQGQKQLFSLARAILRRRLRTRNLAYTIPTVSEETKKNKEEGGVLLLDEFSSSVDVETDWKMQRIILHEFAGYTIVMLSHRLEMVLDFDRVVIMDAGRVVEQGAPRHLIETEGSRFRDLWLLRNPK
ncbi:ABC transporter [Trichoderma velutinum]